MRNAFLNIIKGLHKVLSLLGFRSQRHWGVVYDSVTKQPVDPVVIKLIDAKTGKIVATSVANLSGEYGFMVGPGLYKLFAYRANFVFPSRNVDGPNDGVYENVYTGQTIEFTGESDVLSLNIPLDPIAPDWNQQHKLQVMQRRPRFEYAARMLMRAIFWLLFVFACAQYFLLSEHYVWGIVFFVLFTIVLLAWIVPHVRLWGRVVLKNTKDPVANVEVKVMHPQLPDVVIAHATTTAEGKFFVRLAKGAYVVVLEKGGQVLFSRTVEIGAEGLLNSELYV
jgi:hypothetical protein